MSETQPQPPYLAMAGALRQPDVLDIAELAALRVASATIMAQGGPLPGEPAPAEGLPAEVVAARLLLAKRVIGRAIPQRTLALGLLQAIDVAGALMQPDAASNPAAALLSVDLGAAWVRNWSDYAMLIAATT
jgi:hypothetical protein